MKIFVTGIEGFVGRHLADHLLSLGHDLSGTVWNETQISPMQTLFPTLQLFQADVRNHDVLKEILETVRPDAVVHLAAQSSGGYSFKNPRLTFEVNVLGTVNLFETVAQVTPDARVLLVGSSDAYGLVDERLVPIREDTPFRPVNPYSASKAAQDIVGVQYFHSHGLDIVRARAFPHTGSGQNPIFALPNFARQISAIEASEYPTPMGVGNLEVVRDYLDVEDVVRAYAALLDRGVPGDVYNIASGEGHTLGELLDRLIALSAREIHVEKDPALVRPADVPVLVGDSTKFRKLTGWEPSIPVDEVLRRLLDHWRARQRQGAV